MCNLKNILKTYVNKKKPRPKCSEKQLQKVGQIKGLVQIKGQGRDPNKCCHYLAHSFGYFVVVYNIEQSRAELRELKVILMSQESHNYNLSYEAKGLRSQIIEYICSGLNFESLTPVRNVIIIYFSYLCLCFVLKCSYDQKLNHINA